MKRLAVLFLILAACSPARFARELTARSGQLHQPPVDPVHDIQSSAHGGIGSAGAGDSQRKPVPADGSKLLPPDSSGTGKSPQCAVPAKDGSGSARCMTRYDGIKVSPKKSIPRVSTHNQ